MYHFNRQPENWMIKDYTPGKRANKKQENWGGGQARRLLSAAYTIVFLCLLRFDEVLKIQMHDITIHKDKYAIEISLPFQKTAPCGG
jgi:hypothetical protein